MHIYNLQDFLSPREIRMTVSIKLRLWRHLKHDHLQRVFAAENWNICGHENVKNGANFNCWFWENNLSHPLKFLHGTRYRSLPLQNIFYFVCYPKSTYMTENEDSSFSEKIELRVQLCFQTSLNPSHTKKSILCDILIANHFLRILMRRIVQISRNDFFTNKKWGRGGMDPLSLCRVKIHPTSI